MEFHEIIIAFAGANSPLYALIFYLMRKVDVTKECIIKVKTALRQAFPNLREALK